MQTINNRVILNTDNKNSVPQTTNSNRIIWNTCGKNCHTHKNSEIITAESESEPVGNGNINGNNRY